MKKLLLLAGVVSALGLLTAHAGGIANPEGLNPRNAAKAAAPAGCPCPCARCGEAPCCCKADCPKLANCPKGGECPKAWCAKGECPKSACPKGPRAASQSCPLAKKSKANK